ncbi:MAG: preprotein translocase subunit SecY [Candidatus Zambryskibacteria bacterium RIFCSPHIGHO2_02_FULL_43_14]|uniref:Protein translocase subunit SecY n=1 Tax=Candidatus Zambryskibacteria bacterium RIFCSPHIGHO2_02_FULL_43_14 TaxID=1802748 RepID=A0A1G2TFQ8_9BACT|nr:MAG: preprotein translocase subunit SecY [Candidatus Zambryskibacteria bacterium RIFCSPHIGHO2_01_FULL_43_60]OHA96012.1 MAG: preprotein translocase subunit SecY [Candidatus Zambryskibacteria bacterium RIFCSPHIGHO2_02_FULL_43_14]OHB03101.1 MAG: preprotein translocase subunit SecY [Candidatus Zambryskibacteria bacterium RIFCSPLOWO2_01_FULL_42_41]
MSKFSEKLRFIFGDELLRKRILFVLGILAISRLLAVIPIPGIDVARLQSLFAGSEFLNLLNIFSGGGLSNLSVVMLGVGPYITASIIMQLLTVMVPKLKELYHEEGEAGRRRFAQYSRMLTVPLAVVQGYAFIKLLQGQNILPNLSLSIIIVDILVIVAGSVLLMWLGELITEFGVGNGVSLIIFAGIVSRLPQAAGQLIFTFDSAQIPVYAVGLVVALLIIFGVVVVTEAERPIPITYAKQVRGGRTYGGLSTYLPLRVNQAGVIPIIFALSILLFPQMIFQFLSQSSVAFIGNVADFALTVLANTWFYTSAYFLLVFLFTYFYTAVTFDPDAIATNLQKSGAFISGVRPGEATAEYISRVLTRLTLVGALFLSIIAVLPLILRSLTGIQALAIGGTALLIVVSVVIDLVKKIDAQLSVREY